MDPKARATLIEVLLESREEGRGVLVVSHEHDSRRSGLHARSWRWHRDASPTCSTRCSCFPSSTACCWRSCFRWWVRTCGCGRSGSPRWAWRRLAAAGVVLAAFLVGAGGAHRAGRRGPGGRSPRASSGHKGNEAYALMLLVGWTVALLLAANSAHGDDLSRALVQGQLYFTGAVAPPGLGVVVARPVRPAPVALATPAARRGSSRITSAANGTANPRHDLVFDILVAVTLALAATAIGVMAAFALVFVPPWVAFRFARGWWRTIAWSVAIGVTAYLASFRGRDPPRPAVRPGAGGRPAPPGPGESVRPCLIPAPVASRPCSGSPPSC